MKKYIAAKVWLSRFQFVFTRQSVLVGLVALMGWGYDFFSLPRFGVDFECDFGSDVLIVSVCVGIYLLRVSSILIHAHSNDDCYSHINTLSSKCICLLCFVLAIQLNLWLLYQIAIIHFQNFIYSSFNFKAHIILVLLRNSNECLHYLHCYHSNELFLPGWSVPSQTY